MLTKKQEMFVQNIINGMSQREAYKNAYSVKTMSDNAIDREASLLMKNPKLSQRFKELRDEFVKPTIMTAQERLEMLTEIVKASEEHDINARLKALDIMNKMTGEYVTKVEGTLTTKLEDLL